MTPQDENLKKVDKAADKYAGSDTAKRDKFRDKMDDILKDAQDQHLSDAQMDTLVAEIEKIAEKRDKDIDTVRKQAQEKLKELRMEIVRKEVNESTGDTPIILNQFWIPLNGWKALDRDLRKNTPEANFAMGFTNATILAIPSLLQSLIMDSQFRDEFFGAINKMFHGDFSMIAEGFRKGFEDLFAGNASNDPVVAHNRGAAMGGLFAAALGVGAIGGTLLKITKSVERKAMTAAAIVKADKAIATPPTTPPTTPPVAPVAPHAGSVHPVDPAGAPASPAPAPAPVSAGAPHAAAPADPIGAPTAAASHAGVAPHPITPAIVTVSKAQEELVNTVKAIKSKKAQLKRLQDKDLPTPEAISRINLLTKEITELEEARDILRTTIKSAASETAAAASSIPAPEVIRAMKVGDPRVSIHMEGLQYDVVRISEMEYSITEITGTGTTPHTITVHGESEVTGFFTEKTRTASPAARPAAAPEPAAAGVSTVPAAPDILSRIQTLKVGEEATFIIEDITVTYRKVVNGDYSMTVKRAGNPTPLESSTIHSFSLDDAAHLQRRMKSSEYISRIEQALARHRENLAKLKTEPSTPELESRIATLEGKIATGEEELTHVTAGGEPRLPLPEATARPTTPAPEPVPAPAPAAATAPVTLSEIATARIAELRKAFLADTNELAGLERGHVPSTNLAEEKLFESKVAILRERIAANETELSRLESGGDVIGATPPLATRASQLRLQIAADEETLEVFRTRNGSPAQIKKLTDRIEKRKAELARVEAVTGEEAEAMRLAEERGFMDITKSMLRTAKDATISRIGKITNSRVFTESTLRASLKELHAENVAKVATAETAMKTAKSGLKSFAERNLGRPGRVLGSVFNRSKEAIEARTVYNTAAAALHTAKVDARISQGLLIESMPYILNQRMWINTVALSDYLKATVAAAFQLEEADLNKQIEEYKRLAASTQAAAPVAPVPTPAPAAPLPTVIATPGAPAAPAAPTPAAPLPTVIATPTAPSTEKHPQTPAQPRQSQTVHTSPDPQERQDALDIIAHSHDPLNTYQRKYIADAQQALKDKGLYTGRIDGIPGPLTRGAIEAYRNGGHAPAGQPTQSRHPVYSGNIPEDIMESGSGRIVMAQIGNEKYLIATGETSETKANTARAYAQAGNNA